MDFSAIKEAGLTQEEFGSLVGVTRVTVNTWVRGKMTPHRFAKDSVAATLKALRKAVKSGELPRRPNDRRKLQYIIDLHAG